MATSVAISSSDTPIGLGIVVDGVSVAMCWSQSPAGDSELAATAATVHLTSGQRVWVLAHRNENARGEFWTTFGGHLVRADAA
jgi:hypothetical protein